MTAPNPTAIAHDFITGEGEGKSLVDHLYSNHEEHVREDTFEFLLNLPPVGAIMDEETEEARFYFDGEDCGLIINDFLRIAVAELGLPWGNWMWDDPGTLYRQDDAADDLWETPGGQAQIEAEAHQLHGLATAIYDAFRAEITREVLEEAVDKAVARQQQAQAERDARRAAKQAAEAKMPRIDQAEVERIIGVTRRGFMQDKLRTLPGAGDGPDTLYVSLDNLAGGTVQDLARAMRALLRAGNYGVAPTPGRYLGQAENIYVKYIPGKPPRAEHQLASEEAIVAVIEKRMSEREWVDYLGTLGL
jgi:hypothetical protein